MCAKGCTSIPNFECECNCSSNVGGFTSNYNYLSQYLNTPNDYSSNIGAAYTPGEAGMYEVTMSYFGSDENNNQTVTLALEKNGVQVNDTGIHPVRLLSDSYEGDKSVSYLIEVKAADINTPLQWTFSTNNGGTFRYTLLIKRIA